jgi:hypothetical protein
VKTPLPLHFCWTRYGTEAGETIEQILARKEQERLANGGTFLWGIGNAISRLSMLELLRVEPQPEAVFSPIRNKPSKKDVNPSCVVMWTVGQTLNGCRYELPAGSVVTSHGQRTKHYALVCSSQSPLAYRR